MGDSIPHFSTCAHRLFAGSGGGPCRIGLPTLPETQPMGACLQAALLAEQPHGGTPQGAQGLPLAHLPYCHCQHGIVWHVPVLHSTCMFSFAGRAAEVVRSLFEHPSDQAQAVMACHATGGIGVTG